jgi:hypothetical protein
LIAIKPSELIAAAFANVGHGFQMYVDSGTNLMVERLIDHHDQEFDLRLMSILNNCQSSPQELVPSSSQFQKPNYICTPLKASGLF